eukprot:m.247570 g.247570  ORF g.247570 m.247570 type:complete len:130 (-) comp22600_c1_seq7:34-423(-)
MWFFLLGCLVAFLFFFRGCCLVVCLLFLFSPSQPHCPDNFASRSGIGFFATRSTVGGYRSSCGLSATANVVERPPSTVRLGNTNRAWNEAIAFYWYKRGATNRDANRCQYSCWITGQPFFETRALYVRY